ncbi:heavy metal translocating P-type ATPase [Fusobacterium sp. PH5-44]|uniref:heavy metal translocating P-type ATPase n=1 Tax=unclassified Fusobacterium TaxID=2648384 RepID=UPI003D2316F5
MNKKEKLTIARILVSIICVILGHITGHEAAHHGQDHEHHVIGQLMHLLEILPIIFCGIPIFISAIKSLVKDYKITTELFVCIVIIIAIVSGEFHEAIEISVIMSIGLFLEEFAINKAKMNINNLLELLPKTARVVSNDNEKIVDIDQVKENNIIRVNNGESIPVDGIIIDGICTIDQSTLTGESLPVDRVKDCNVYNGTVVQNGSIDVLVTKIGENTTLGNIIKIIDLMKDNKSTKSRLLDKWTSKLSIVALIFSLIIWWCTNDINNALKILLVFCPCALVISSPLSIMISVKKLMKKGILCKGGGALEAMGKITKIAFDKTGTLTYGKLSVKKVTNNSSYDDNRFLEYVYSLESKSDHPIGKAIEKYCIEKGVNAIDTLDFERIIGKGLTGIVDEKIVITGNKLLLKEKNVDIICPDEIINVGTIIYVAIDGRYSGSIVLTDTLKENAKETIKFLNEIGIESMILSGDESAATKFVGESLEIKEIYSNLLPERKVEILEKYKNNNEKVAMVGDGINDALSLKASYVGIAMGQMGNYVAVDAADIVLINDKLKNIPYLVNVAKSTILTINVNIILAVVLNIIAIIFVRYFGLKIAAISHNIILIIILMNSFSLFFKK